MLPFVDRWRKLTDYAEEIVITKRAQRGTANIQRQGVQGVFARISEDKFERIKRWSENVLLRRLLQERGMEAEDIKKLCGEPTTEELAGVEDDLFDISNYCLMAILLIRGEWEDKNVSPAPDDVPF